MSSFLGHTIAALTVSQTTRIPRYRYLWCAWLVILASAPDLDYLFPVLHLGPLRYRITHSLIGALILPSFTVSVLCFFVRDLALLRRMATQAFLAGFSHLVLDLLVGVTPLPLWWPFSLQRVQLPFGLLPSAGGISLSNPYLYRNTFIELGILVPLSALLVLWSKLSPVRRALCAAVSIAFIGWSLALSR